MIRRLIITALLVVGGVSFGLAQNDSIATQNIDSLSERKNLFLAFPAAYYYPETRWGFGVAGIYNYYIDKEDAVSPSSQFQLAASYTQNKQVLIYLPFKLYWKEWSNVIEGEFGYYDYLYPFFGLGDQTRESAFEQYNSRYFRFQLDAFKKVKNNVYAGIRYWMDTPDIYKLEENGLLDQSSITGRTGGVISGIGPQVRIDRRDNVYSSKSGSYVNLIYQGFHKSIGSDFNFGRVRIDARKYFNYKRTVIAGQFYSDINWGDVPFFQKARLGGAKTLRGYLDGRFIDNISVVPQLETRFPIWKKVGGVAFLSSGTVMNEIEQLFSTEWKYSYGAGLRVTIDEEKQIKVRIDYAFTPEGSNFYFTIGEAF